MRQPVWCSVCLALSLLLWATTGHNLPPAEAAEAAAAPNPGHAAADFEAELVQEAVDLSAVTSATGDGLPDDQKEMESLLHWAIEHSDKDALHQKAEEVRRDEAIRDYQERKQRVKELSDIVSQQPTETQLMQDQLGTLSDAAASTADKEAALAELQVLVEPIDNANDLMVLGGLEPLVSLLADDTAPSLQAGAAYVLGTAVSNNEKLAAVLVQEHPGLLQQLLTLASSRSHEEVANKAMYALARLVAGPAPAARSAFYNMGGLPQLQALLGAASGASTRVKTRAVNLVTDLIEMTANGDDTSLDTWNESAMAAFGAASLDLLQQSETLDVKEKALFAMRTLLLRRGPAGGAALAQEGAEAVLREALIELDLLSDSLKAQADAAAEAAGEAAGSEKAAAAAGSENQGGRGAATVGEGGQGNEEEDVEDAESVADQAKYAQYVGHLCADVLHHLSVHHDEL